MSYYSELLKKKRESSTAASVSKPVKPSKEPTHLCDFPETDTYRFVVKEKNSILADGSLMKVKLALPESYLKKKIRSVVRNRETMTVVLDY